MLPRKRPKQQATIIDVARELRLAPSTVSNALRGKPAVAEATRERVLAKCREMNYEASPVARALRARCTFTVGVLLPDISNPVFGEIVKGIDGILAPAGFATLLASTEGSRERFVTSALAFVKREVDALVMVSQPVDGGSFDRLVEAGPPIVLTHRRSAAHKLDYIGMDNFGGSTAAVRYLASLGHQRIAFIEGPRESSAAAERLNGYRRVVAEFGLDDDENLICEGDYMLLSGFKAAHRLLTLKDRPSAIVAANDLMACAAMDVAAQMGLVVPRDLSVVGFDDIFVSSFPQIALTTVRQPALEIGQAIGHRLLDRFARDPAEPCEIVLPSDLVVRSSVCPAAQKQPACRHFSERDLDIYLQNRWKPTSEVHP